MQDSDILARSYSRLQKVIEDLLREQSPLLLVTTDFGYPLLSLETSTDSAGFAVVNGSPELSYASAYDAFKKLYRQKHALWQERNLSFVVCRSEPKSSDDAFFSALETDVYFCRKYVICLSRGHAELERELFRLPFLPLPEGRTGGVLRPPSALTLLQSLNVSAQLARQIVVPREYSAQHIVRRLLAGKETLPTLDASESPVPRDQYQPTERTRIRSVEIKAFRAYRSKQEFDVDADVVVLYGPNGLGKTSFFDAIDYVCTGRIGRLCRRRIRPKQFINLARHLGSSGSDSYVSIQVSQGASACSVRRNVATWGDALIGGERHDRASTLQFLTSARWGTRKARIENLERLFRATHLFGQSAPELLVEFEQDSTLSPDLVYRMLALDDYASGKAKVASVLVHLDQRIEQNRQQIGALKARAGDLQSRIEELRGLQQDVPFGGEIRTAAAELARDLWDSAGRAVDDTEPSVESSRVWRAIAEAALVDAQGRLRRIERVESGYEQFERNTRALQTGTVELSELEAALRRQTAEYKRQQEVRNKLVGSLEKDRGVLAHAEARLRALGELSDLQEVFHNTNSSLRQWEQELKRVAREEEMTTTELLPLLRVEESLSVQIAELQELLRTQSQQLETLSAIQLDLPSWHEKRAELVSLRQAHADADLAILTGDASIAALKAGIAAKEQELTAFEQEYGAHTADKLELTRLLDGIEAYVEDGICPACGADHRSRTILLERLHAQKRARPAYLQEPPKRCTDLRNALKQDRASLSASTSERTSKMSELQVMADKLAEAREAVAMFERTVAGAGLPLTSQLAVTLASRIEEKKRASQSSQTTLEKLESELASTSRRITGLAEKRVQQAAARERAAAAIEPLEKQSVALRSKAEELGLSLDMAPSELSDETAAARVRQAAARERIGELAPRVDALTQCVRVGEARIIEAEQRIEALRQDQARVESELDLYREEAAAVLERDALAGESIAEQRRLITKRVDVLGRLRQRCLTLELTLDAAQRSATLAELEFRAQSFGAEEQTLLEAADRMSAMRSWFAGVEDALDKQSSGAVAAHVDALGPLTTVIQKRLRAVYGFGDISLRARGNTIRVEVSWDRERVKPADYFSESQKQILMLSLFLAGRLTQTWSGFAPILLDDPVTHFDDLNAFAFVELIRGLVGTSPGKRQFIISTCEDRLFELMLKKLSRIEGGARFYRFEGIGCDGPVISKIG